MRAGPRLEVWKFGGAALADADGVRNAVKLIREHRGPLVVVVSALSGVTDSLLDGARDARAGDTKAAAAASAAFLRRHRDIAQTLDSRRPVAPEGARHRRRSWPASTTRSPTPWPAWAT